MLSLPAALARAGQHVIESRVRVGGLGGRKLGLPNELEKETMANSLLPPEERNLTPDQVEALDKRRDLGHTFLVIAGQFAVIATVLLLWVIAIFNSRGVARLALRPWRKMKNYGYALIAGTTVLALAFDLAIEPYAAQIRHFWFWQPTKIPVTWHGASPLAFLGWTFATLIIMGFTTPFLIRKQPGGHSSPDYAPVALWIGAVIFCAAGAAQAGIWSAAIVDAVFVVVTAGFCWRGAKW